MSSEKCVYTVMQGHTRSGVLLNPLEGLGDSVGRHIWGLRVLDAVWASMLLGSIIILTGSLL